jgi:hypothetical protein
LDTVSALQVFGSERVGKLADEQGREIGKSSVPDQAALNPKLEALARAIRQDLGVTD